MNRNTKKGFTIVELIIVIAVIGILAAVLIPTFSGLIRKAMLASDEALVKNLNTALAADAENGTHATMTEALTAAKNFGFDVDKINAKVGGNEILWDSYNDCFVYLDEGEVTYIPDSKVNGEAPKYKLWKIYDNAADIPATTAQVYSVYLADNEATTIANNLSVGFDAGQNNKLTTINYVNTTEAREVVIRTNGAGTTLNVNGYIAADGSGDKVYHYGACGKVVANVAMHCYYENGNTAYVELTKGKLVASQADAVSVLYINPANGAEIAVDATNGAVANAYAIGTVTNVNVDVEIKTANEIVELGEAAVNYAKDNEDLSQFEDKTLWIDCKAQTFAGGTGTKEDPYKIASARQLALLAYNVNNGVEGYATASYLVTADIDLSGKGWTPIGNLTHTFGGNFSAKYNTDKAHVIKGMNDVGFDAKMSETVSTTYTQSTGNVYGLFGIVGTLEGETAVEKQTFEYVELKDVAINSKTGIIVAGLVGADTASVKKDKAYLNTNLATDYSFNNIVIGGEIKLVNTESATIAGVVCKLYTAGAVELNYCANNATLTALQEEGFKGNNTTAHKGAGVAGYLKNNKSVVIDNCTNNGTIVINGYMFAGIYMAQVDSGKTGSLQVTNCRNTATIYNYGYHSAMNSYKDEYTKLYCGGAVLGYNTLSGTMTNKTTTNNANTGKVIWEFDCTWTYENVQYGGSWNKTYADNSNEYNFRVDHHADGAHMAELN